MLAADIGTFDRMVSVKLVPWICKRRALSLIKRILEELAAIGAKLVRREALDRREQSMYESFSSEELTAKSERLVVFFLLSKMRNAKTL